MVILCHSFLYFIFHQSQPILICKVFFHIIQQSTIYIHFRHIYIERVLTIKSAPVFEIYQLGNPLLLLRLVGNNIYICDLCENIGPILHHWHKSWILLSYFLKGSSKRQISHTVVNTYRSSLCSPRYYKYLQAPIK